MPTLLVSRTCQPEADQLANVAQDASWHHQWLGKRSIPDRLHGDDFGIYAETDIALAVARKHALVLIEPSLNLLATIPHAFTSRHIEFMSLGDAFKLPDRRFIKPADCTNKAFDASVWERGASIFCADDLSRDTPVLVSEPVEWSVEYRVVVHERTVVTFSPYIRDGWLARDSEGRWPYPSAEADEMLSFCGQFLRDERIVLPPAFVLDVGLIRDRGWSIIEFNPIWCSGLLGCNLELMLPVSQRICYREVDAREEDACRIVRRGEDHQVRDR